MTKPDKDIDLSQDASHVHLMSASSISLVTSIHHEDDSSLKGQGPGSTRFNILAIFGYIWSLIVKLCRSEGGIKYMIAAELSASVMAVTTRALETTQDPPFGAMQILCVRMIFTSLFCTIYMYYKDIPDKFGTRGVGWALIIRGISGFFGVFGLYYSLSYLSLSEATILTFLSPSITGITCWFFLKEALYPWEVVGTFFSMAGVLLIVKPPFLFSHHDDDQGDESNDDVSHAQRMLACGVALFGVAGIVCAYTMIRLIGNRVHPLVNVTYFSHTTLIISSLWLLLSPTATFVLPHTFLEWVLIFILGICGFAMQFLVTQALMMERASKATNMIYLQLFFAIIFEKIIWGTSPDWWSILGSVLIIGSSLVIALMKDRTKKSTCDEEGLPRNKSSLSESQELEELGPSTSDDANAVEFDFENTQNTTGLHERTSLDMYHASTQK